MLAACLTDVVLSRATIVNNSVRSPSIERNLLISVERFFKAFGQTELHELDRRVGNSAKVWAGSQ